MIIVGRSAWGARPPRSRSTLVRRQRYKVHWTFTCSGTSIEAEKSAVRGIQRHHMDNNGWSDIAYNFLIGPSGTIYEGRGHNIRSAANGGTVTNFGHMAVALIAKDICQATPAQKEALGEFLRRYAKKDVKGHRDGHSTTCPGDQIYGWLQDTFWIDPLVEKTGYWAFRGWWLSIGQWEGRGRKEAGRRYRPNVPRVIPPAWWVRLARSLGKK